MPLREHLRELRNRLLKAGAAVALGAVAGWYLYDSVYQALQEPIEKVARERGGLVTLNLDQIATSFNLQLRMSFYIGIVLSSPVWLYQLWAFIVPGLTRREKRRAIGFAAAGVPLFAGGLGLAWLVLPNAVRFLTNFTPAGTANVINASDYLAFVTQIMLAFGIAFVVPLLLVALNMAGVVSAAALAKGWRVAVFMCFLFAAIASPSPDAGSMLALAFPMVGLYMIAVAIAWVTDRRRARRAAAEGFGDLSDDEASPLQPDAFDPAASYDAATGVEAAERPPRP